jgi:hypothetical protein
MGGSPMAVIIAGLNTFPEIFDLMEARLDSVGDGPIVQSMTTSPGPETKLLRAAGQDRRAIFCISRDT